MDDRNFPLFVATIELKRPRKKEKKIQQQSEELLKTKEEEKKQEVAEKEESDTFPFGHITAQIAIFTILHNDYNKRIFLTLNFKRFIEFDNIWMIQLFHF